MGMRVKQSKRVEVQYRYLENRVHHVGEIKIQLIKVRLPLSPFMDRRAPQLASTVAVEVVQMAKGFLGYFCSCYSKRPFHFNQQAD